MAEPFSPVDHLINRMHQHTYNPMTWVKIAKGCFDLFKLGVVSLGVSLTSVLYVGHGRRAIPTFAIWITTAIMMTMSDIYQTLAGDIIFVIWVLVIVKWVAERIWAYRRVRAGSREHEYMPGVFILGNRGVLFERLLVLGLCGMGLLLCAIDEMRPCGVLLALAASMAMIQDIASAKRVRAEAAEQINTSIDAELRAAAFPNVMEEPKRFQDVTIC